MKECVVTTFDANVALYEENIRKADSQRMLAGWQFLPFCRQKVPIPHQCRASIAELPLTRVRMAFQEALADSFEAMTLYEDALIQYDELEAAFFQHVKGVWPYRQMSAASQSWLTSPPPVVMQNMRTPLGSTASVDSHGGTTPCHSCRRAANPTGE